MASACDFTCASVTVVPYEPQLFRPIGGVGASSARWARTLADEGDDRAHGKRNDRQVHDPLCVARRGGAHRRHRLGADSVTAGGVLLGASRSSVNWKQTFPA